MLCRLGQFFELRVDAAFDSGGGVGVDDSFGCRFVGGGLHIGNRLFGGFGISGGASSAGAFDDGAIAGA